MSVIHTRKQALLRDAGKLWVPARPAIIRPRARGLLPGFCIPHVISAAAAAADITFVGSAVGTVVNGGTVSINVSGIGLAQNDIVIVLGGSTAGTPASPSGYSSVHTQTGTDIRCSLSYKIQTSTPDTSVSIYDTGTTSDCGCGLAMAFRSVSTSSPLDVTTVELVGTGPSVDPITPTTNDCAIVAMLVFSEDRSGDAAVSPLNYLPDPPIQEEATDSNGGVSVLGAYRILVGGGGASEDPFGFSGWSGGGSSESIGYTMALRPA